jgi:hypothetical protein
MAAAANATTTRIVAHLGRQELMSGTWSHYTTLSVRLLPQNHHRIHGGRRRAEVAETVKMRAGPLCFGQAGNPAISLGCRSG